MVERRYKCAVAVSARYAIGRQHLGRVLQTKRALRWLPNVRLTKVEHAREHVQEGVLAHALNRQCSCQLWIVGAFAAKLAHRDSVKDRRVLWRKFDGHCLRRANFDNARTGKDCKGRRDVPLEMRGQVTRVLQRECFAGCLFRGAHAKHKTFDTRQRMLGNFRSNWNGKGSVLRDELYLVVVRLHGHGAESDRQSKARACTQDDGLRILHAEVVRLRKAVLDLVRRRRHIFNHKFLCILATRLPVCPRECLSTVYPKICNASRFAWDGLTPSGGRNRRHSDQLPHRPNSRARRHEPQIKRNG
eukprot:Opistho-2@23191